MTARPHTAHLTRSIALTVTLCAIAIAPVHAGADDFWNRPDPDREPTKFEEAMHRGDTAAKAAAFSQRAREQRQAARQAVHFYEEAIALDATAAEPHYRAAEVSYRFLIHMDNSNPMNTDLRRTLDHWNAFEAMRPHDWRIRNFRFRRSIVYSKLGGADSYERALDDYEHELRELSDRRGFNDSYVAQVLSNSAELLMALGLLDQAILRYEAALERQTSQQALYKLGLAVAYDRDGQEEQARELILSAIHNEAELDRELTEDGVFFVPDGDIHYYYAIAHEALGNYATARFFYEQFIDQSRQTAYVARAKDHLARLGDKPDPKPTRDRHRSSPWDAP